MTQIQPYRREAAPVPLTGGARFIRGFRRVGIVLAVLTGMAGMSLTCIIAAESARSVISKVQQEQCIRARYVSAEMLKPKWNDPKSIDLWDSGCGGPTSYISMDELRRLPRATLPDFASQFLPVFATGTLISCAAAALMLLMCLTVGWIAAGFTRH